MPGSDILIAEPEVIYCPCVADTMVGREREAGAP